MSSVESRIIEAAIAVIEKHGLQEATVRAIAEEAGVNVSAINYYFRSKEQLLDRVLDVSLDNAFDWSHFGDGEGASAAQRLADILDHMTKGAQEYPQISRMHFYEPLVLGQCSPKLGDRFREFMETMLRDLQSRGTALEDAALRAAILQALTAAIFGMALLTPLFSGFSHTDFRDPLTRREALLALTRGLLGEN